MKFDVWEEATALLILDVIEEVVGVENLYSQAPRTCDECKRPICVYPPCEGFVNDNIQGSEQTVKGETE